MPYDSNSELPAGAKDLPDHGQDIFRKAFNSAWSGKEDEEKAFKIAWAAVNNSYEKVDGKWKAKPSKNSAADPSSNVIDLAKWKKLKSAIKLYAREGDEPPREIMIFPIGKTITTTKGNFVLTDSGAREVMQEYISHGTDLHFDYEHLSIEPEKNASPELAKAAGWFDLELRNDGLWATNIRWTDAAEKMIRAKEYRYISPAFHADENGEIHSLVNVALTNLPATDNLSALIAASMRERLSSRQVDNNQSIVTSSINRSPSKESKMKAHPLSKHLKAHLKAKGIDHAELAKGCGVSEERMKHLTAGHPPTTEEMTDCAKHLSLSEDESKKLAEEHGEFLKNLKDEDEADGEGAHKEPDGDEAPPIKNTFDNKGASAVPEKNSAADETKVKGGKDNADENEGGGKPPAKTTVREDGGLSRDELIALTGSTDPKEQRRKLAAMRDNQPNDDREFLKKMRAESLSREKSDLVALAKSQNRWTANWEKFFETKPNELLREMLTSGAMPAIGGEELQTLMPSGVEGITLLRSDSRYITMCRVLGVSDDPKEYAKVKADIVSLRSNAFDTQGFPISRGGASLGPAMTRRLMDSWMGLKAGKEHSGDKRFVSRHELRRTARKEPAEV
jgi:cation transport regulator ChaB